MSNLKDKAKEYLKAQLSVIPITEDKLPALPTWKPYQSQRIKEEEVDSLFSGSNVKGLAIICGAISGNLEVIDVDVKYDVTGELWMNLRNLILLEDSLSGIFDELLIARTVNKGYHIFYICDELESSQKLAFNIEGKCIIETRGEGGYVASYPSPGYEFIQGSVDEIPTITPLQRKKLFEITESLSYVEPTIEEEEVVIGEATTGLPCWDDYNNRATTKDVLKLLEAHNWSEVKTDKEGRIYVLRPATDEPSTAKYSGNICKIKKDNKEICLFSVFTDNGSPFTENVMREGKPVKDEKGKFKKQAYTPFKIYALLEHNGDSSKASKELYKLGYGERISKPDNQEKTELIKVEVVNRVTGEISVISTPGENINIKNVKKAIGDEVVITSPGPEAQEEILRTIALLQETGKRIYVKEGETEIREYRYQLRAIFIKYRKVQGVEGDLTDRDIDNLQDEIVTTSLKLDNPVDRDIFLKDFLSQEAIKELGISEESLSITVDRLTSTKEKEAQKKKIKDVLENAHKYNIEGRPDLASKYILEEGRKLLKLDKGASLSKLLEITSRQKTKRLIQGEPDSLFTGYTLMNGIGSALDLELPSGALSIVTARTSHRKTCLMMNIALNIATSKKEGEVYFFTYEESREEILIKMMNIYINENMSSNNLKYIKEYYKNKDETKFYNETFLRKEDNFYSELIDTGRLKVSYPALETNNLCIAIEQIKAKAKPIVIFIDYIQQLRIDGMGSQPKQIQLQEICENLRETAKNTGLPIVLGAQFNRTVEQEGDIDSSKIREAGDVEQTANLVLGLWDRNFTKKDGTHKDRKGNKAKYEPGTLYVELLKGRGIEPGAFGELPYTGNTGKINNYQSSGRDPLK